LQHDDVRYGAFIDMWISISPQYIFLCNIFQEEIIAFGLKPSFFDHFKADQASRRLSVYTQNRYPLQKRPAPTRPDATGEVLLFLKKG